MKGLTVVKSLLCPSASLLHIPARGAGVCGMLVFIGTDTLIAPAVAPKEDQSPWQLESRWTEI